MPHEKFHMMPRCSELALTLVSCFIALTTADLISCGGGCELALSRINFPDVSSDLAYYPTQCGSHQRLISVSICTRFYCTHEEVNQGWNRFNSDCQRYGNVTLPPVNFTSYIHDGDILRMPRFTLEQYTSGTNFSHAAIPDERLQEVAQRTKHAWNESVIVRSQYGNAMLYFWFFVVSLGILTRIPTAIISISHCYPASPNHGVVDSVTEKTKNFVRRRITVPALISHHCSEPIGWMTIPPRLQSLTLLTFVTLNIVLCCVNYEVFPENLLWSADQQWSRYVADRTGVISVANLPLIWLFATRNNFILAVTGWSFETAMQFHRWVARISTIEAIVHSIAYTVLSFQSGGWQSYWNDWTYRYWVMGVIATAAMSMLCVFSVYPLRHAFYEVFLTLHIALGILTLVGMWYHVEIADGEYDWFLYPCLFIWLFDRVCRLCRLAYLNFRTPNATLEYDHASDFLWLTAFSSVLKSPRPGDYYFLYLLRGHTFYESHPFTLSSWDVTAKGHLPKPSLNFLIRPYDGFTRRLASIARNGVMKTRILVEGPYGSIARLSNFDSMVFVVGGTGVAIALAHLKHLSENWNRSLEPRKICHIRVIWAVQQIEMFEQLYHRQLKTRLDEVFSNGVEFEFDVFVTRSSQRPTSSYALPVNSGDGTMRPGTTGELLSFALPPCQAHRRSLSTEVSPLLSPESVSPHLNGTELDGQDDSGSLSPLIPETASEHSIPTSGNAYRLNDNKSFRIHHARPDICLLVREASRWRPYKGMSSFDVADDAKSLVEGSSSSGRREKWRIALVSCGPPSLADATRAAVVDALASPSCGDVQYFNESYTW